MVYDLYPGITGGLGGTVAGGTFGSFKGKLYMCGRNASSGFELVAYDGVNPPAVAVDISPGGPNVHSNPYGFTAYGNALFFAAQQSTLQVPGQTELFCYNGVAAPQRIPIGSNPAGSGPRNFIVFKGTLYFSAKPVGTDYLFFQSDTSGNYLPAKGASPFKNLGMYAMVQNPTGGKLYFSAYSPGYGYELWSYDGDTAIRLTDLAPGSKDGLPNNSVNGAAPTVFNGLVYFSGSTDSVKYRLYAYNPASGQANLVDTIITGGGRKIIDNYAGMIVYNDALYFGAYDSATGCELWKYNGATAGMVADIYPGPQSGMDVDNAYRI